METIELNNPAAVPVIYTTKGNLRVSDLHLVMSREDTPECVVLIEEYFLGEESVKRAVHVCPLVGLKLGAEQAQI